MDPVMWRYQAVRRGAWASSYSSPAWPPPTRPPPSPGTGGPTDRSALSRYLGLIIQILNIIGHYRLGFLIIKFYNWQSKLGTEENYIICSQNCLRSGSTGTWQNIEEPVWSWVKVSPVQIAETNWQFNKQTDRGWAQYNHLLMMKSL